MKANLLLGATAALAIALAAAHETAAQTQPLASSPSSATPVQLTVPASGLTFNFSDIDRNGDRSISIEEWNAFVASLPSRAAAKDSGSAASGGATTAPRPSQPQPR